MPGEPKTLDTGSAETAQEAEDRDPTRHGETTEDQSEPPDEPTAAAPVADKKGARAAPWLIAAGAFAIYTLLSVLRYERRESMSWDLGIFTEAVRGYAHFKAPMVDVYSTNTNLLGDHWSPILMLLAPVFRVFPSPVTLLVAQSALLALAAVPLTRTAMDLLGRRQGCAIGIAYGLSWGIVQAANFDFHEMAFAVPAVAFSLCAYIRGEDRKAVLWALPLLFVKEDLALLAPVIVAMVVARTRCRGRVVAQAIVLVCGVVLGLLVTALLAKIVIPHFSPDGVYRYWYESGCLDPNRHTEFGKLLTCVPQQLMNGVGVKEQTVLMLLLPVAFVAVRSPLVLLTVPAVTARFINILPSYWGTGWHYSAVPLVVIFAAAIHGLLLMKQSRERAAQDAVEGATREPGRIRTGLRTLGDAQLKHGAVAMLAVAAALTQSFPLQDLWRHQTWFPGGRAAAIKHAEAAVPSGVTVEATAAMLPALATRTDALWIGNPNIVMPPEYEAFDIDRTGWAGQSTALDFVRFRHPGFGYAQVFADPKYDVYVFKRTD